MSTLLHFIHKLYLFPLKHVEKHAFKTWLEHLPPTSRKQVTDHHKACLKMRARNKQTATKENARC